MRAAPHAVVEHTTARQRRRREHPAIALNLTSMIDVVFLLLVYFMVATEFRVGEEVYRLDLPDRAPAQGAADPFDLDDEPLRVRVASAGPRPDDYQLRLEGPYPQPRTFDDLERILEERRLGVSGPGGLFADDHPIVLLPARDARWTHAMEAFDAVARAGYVNVVFGDPG